MPAVDVAVVGAGVAGLSVAAELSAAGWSVAISSARPEASAVPSALLHPFPGGSARRPGVLEAFSRARALVARHAPTPAVKMLRPLAGPGHRLWRAIAAVREPARRLGIDIDELSAAEVGRQFPRVLDPGPALLYGPAFSVDTATFLGSMRAELAGRAVHFAAATEALERRGARWHLSGTELEPVARVVLCPGSHAAGWFPELGLSRVAGEIALVTGDRPIEHAISAGGVHLVPHPPGRRAALGATRRGADDEVSDRAAAAELLKAPLTTDELVVESIWRGIRVTHPGDRRPIVGAVPGADGVFVCTGFGATGYLWAPHAAALLAGAMTGRGEVPPDIRADRFRRWSSPRIRA